jgi:outer membrane protein assembly factor BamB
MLTGKRLVTVAAVAASAFLMAATALAQETPKARETTSAAGAAGAASGTGAANAGGAASTVYGSPNFVPTPERVVGWRGDWAGRFPGATPPTTWSRRVTGITNEIRYQAAKPSPSTGSGQAGEPGKDSRPLEYFTIKDWLVAGPFPADDAAKAMDQDLLDGEAAVQPAEGAKAGACAWKLLRADVATQSRHDVNGGMCGQTWVDFVYAFAKCAPAGYSSVTLEGDVANKVAYAHTYIYAPKADKVRLHFPMLGAAGRVWVNGKPSDLNPKDNGSPWEEKRLEVTLEKGWNRLLVKIASGKGTTPDAKEWRSAWMFAAYIEPVAPCAYETTNIAWMTKMTNGRSTSQPIVVGDRVFIGSGISDLMCLDKATGKVLWLRTTTPYDALTAEERQAVDAQVKPLVDQLNRQNDEVVAAINAGVSPQGLSADATTALDKKLKDKAETEKKIHDAFAAIDKKKYPPYYQNEVSSSNATPCSDGTRVYWAVNSSAAAIVCFGLDGKRLWSHHETLGSAEHGVHASPCLVDGKLIFNVSRTLLALDSATGKEAWRQTNVPMGFATSPQVVRIGGAPLILTATKLIRPADGVEVCDGFDADASCTNVVDNGLVFNLWHFRGWSDPESLRVYKLPTGAAAKAKAEVFWDPPRAGVSTPVRGACGYISGGLVVDGILYGVDTAGGLIAADAQAKKGLYQIWLDGYNRFHRYNYGVCASPTLAGKTIYITDDAGYTHLIQPGPQFKELGSNVIENIHVNGSRTNPCRQESFYTSPYFDGPRMLLRGEEYLYCIQKK